MKGPTLILLAVALALPLPVPPDAGSPAGRQDFAGSVDFVQRLDGSVPAGLRFHDESGNAVQLGNYFGTDPVGLVLSYYSCTTLCPTQIRNLAQRITQASGAAARQAQVLVVSVDPTDSPAVASQSKHRLLDPLMSAERAQRWHFLSGAPQDIAALTESVGFRYGYDAATHQYAHPAGFALLTPEGRIAGYFFGFDFTAEQLDRAFDQASRSRIASPIERLLLACFHYELRSGIHTNLIVALLRVLSVVLVIALFALTSTLLRRTRRRAAEPRT
jgi:protein SCO1